MIVVWVRGSTRAFQKKEVGFFFFSPADVLEKFQTLPLNNYRYSDAALLEGVHGGFFRGVAPSHPPRREADSRSSWVQLADLGHCWVESDGLEVLLC